MTTTTTMDTSSTDQPLSSCPCATYDMDQIAKIVQQQQQEEGPSKNNDSLQRLIDWIQGPNLTCRKQQRPAVCRLTTARRVLQAIRDSFPTVDEPTTATAAATSFSGATTTTSSSTSHSLSVADTNAFPPLSQATASSSNNKPPQTKSNATTTNNNNNKEAFPPLKNPPKKGKRRIRPAIVSTSPLSSSSSHKTDPVWGGSSSQASPSPSNGENIQSSAWPLQTTTTTTTQQSNQLLLENRLSSTTQGKDATLSSFSTITPTKKKPTAVTLVVTPTKQKTVTTDENQSTTTHLVDPIMVQQTPPPAALCRLVDLYIAIVEASLVHSTPHEVLYVLRLLQGATTRPTWQQLCEQAVFGWMTINKDMVVQQGQTSDNYLRLISVQFACRVLDKLCHRLLCWGLASHLADCPPIQQYCPQVHDKVQEYLGRSIEHHHRSIPRTTTAFWTLPFDEMRDSRNRYRTQDEMALYKNREETRDAFLSHLRSFYNQGSSVVQTASSKSAEQVRKAARWVLDPLMDDNVPWLAEFFTDMLLQIGSVPVQETDREVLKMADQEKVQKLHQRFKTPARKGGGGGGGRNKKTIPVVQDGSRTTVVQEEFFRGHQEFFYYFIMLADSHKLNFHLRHQFLEKIYQMSSGLSSSNLDRNLDDLCLLGRFLGVLVFSPNWHSSKISLDESRSRSLVYDELELLRFGGHGILSYLRESRGQRRLISVVPWLVELLRMSVWYEAFRRTKSFRNVALELRGLQLMLSKASQQASEDCRELLLLYFESFADEIAGLDWMEEISMEDIANDSIEAIVADTSEGLDTECSAFEIGTIFAANSRTENILILVTDMAKSSRGVTKSPGASRKVRPSVVVSASREKPPEYQPSDLKSDGESRLQKELRASFFHLHRDLQEICDFSVNRVMNTLLQLWKEVFVEEFLIFFSDECVDWVATQEGLRQQYTSRMKAELEKCLKRSLHLFAPDCDDGVKRIATELSVDQGMQAGQHRVDAKLLEAVTTAKADFEKAKKLKITKKSTAEKTQSRVSLITLNLSRINELIVRKEVHEMEKTSVDVLEAMKKAEDSLESWIAMEPPENPPEEDLRSLYCSVAALDTSFSTLLASWANTDIETNAWLILEKVFRIAAQSCRLCSFGFQSVKRALASLEFVAWLIPSGARCSDARRVKVLVEELCRARLIPIRLRKEALREVEKISHAAE